MSSKICHKAHISYELMSPEGEILAVDLVLSGCTAVTFVNVYFPAGFRRVDSLDDFIARKSRVIVAGDFNAHHVSWGFRTDSCGLALWGWLQQHGLRCHNSRSATFLRAGARSVLDLTLASESVVVSSWGTLTCGANSDHFPIEFQLHCPLSRVEARVQKFVNAGVYQKALRESLTSLLPADPVVVAEQTMAALRSAAKRAEFTVSGSGPARISNWWTPDCTRDYRRRKAALKALLHNQCPVNWLNYKYMAAVFKRTVAKAKADYHTNLNTFLSASTNKHALYRFMHGNQAFGPAQVSASVVLSPADAVKSLEHSARELAARFSARCGSFRPMRAPANDFVTVSPSELFAALASARPAAPGPDGVTVGAIKFLAAEFPKSLLNVINVSLRQAWIPDDWKLAKVILLQKKAGLGFGLDNLRPISLTSNMIKLIERIVYKRLSAFMSALQALSPVQIGFRSGCSIWNAHVDLETRIQLARKDRRVSALVTLDVAQAYDSVEHGTLLSKFDKLDPPTYLFDWIKEFLSGREFFCSSGKLASCRYPQTRGVPQGSVLSPLLFNILLSDIPVHPDVTVYVYADDVAFFASADDIHVLYQFLQAYLNALEGWLDGIHLSLNVKKCAVLVFPVSVPVHVSIVYRNEPIPQVASFKYLGVVYDSSLDWRLHINCVLVKAERAFGRLKRLCCKRTGMRRDTLLLLYRAYVRPILEFGCVLFSGSPAYKLRPLYLLERRILRMCLGLPRFVSTCVLYLEARMPELSVRFRLLTIQTFLRIYETPSGVALPLFVCSPRLFFVFPWPRRCTPQVIFVQNCLSSLSLGLHTVRPVSFLVSKAQFFFDDIFPSSAKLHPQSLLAALLAEYVSSFPSYPVVYTDASQCSDKAGAGIFSDSFGWSFSLRLQDHTPIFVAEFLAIGLALWKVPSTVSQVLVCSDSLSVISALQGPTDSLLFHTFLFFVPEHVREVRFVWVPGHVGLYGNEMADRLAGMAVQASVQAAVPNLSFVTISRLRRFWRFDASGPQALLSNEEYKHLMFAWNPRFCSSRQCEASLTQLRCRVPRLNLYLFRSGLSGTDLCAYCQVPETIDHFFLHCRRFSAARQVLLEEPLRRMGLAPPLSVPVILSFGATRLGHAVKEICLLVHEFVSDSGRFSC